MKSIRKKNYGGWNKKKYNSKNYLRLQKKIAIKRMRIKFDKAKKIER
jgi:hypothetical protein